MSGNPCGSLPGVPETVNATANTTIVCVLVSLVSMKAVRTVDEKSRVLKERDSEQRDLGRTIDRLIVDGNIARDEADTGCMGRGLCPTIGRRVARFLGLSQRPKMVSTKEIEVSVTSSGRSEAVRANGSEISRAVLGLVPSRKKTPQSKLAAASEAMQTRIQSLDSRAADSRVAATASIKAGNKTTALRELKRAKMLEKQAQSTQSAMDALEAQSDMLEQTALQKEVAAALGASAKSLKREKGLISKAEDAVDTAAEVRDMHEDLTQVMSGLGDTVFPDVDEEELLSELQGMVEKEDDVPVAPQNVLAVEENDVELAEQIARDVAVLERKHQEYEKLEKKRQNAMSTAKNPRERQGLLVGSA